MRALVRVEGRRAVGGLATALGERRGSWLGEPVAMRANCLGVVPLAECGAGTMAGRVDLGGDSRGWGVPWGAESLGGVAIAKQPWPGGRLGHHLGLEKENTKAGE